LTPGVALVTGGRRGIGKAIAVALAETGMTVAVTSRHADTALDAVVAELGQAGGSGVAVALDLGDRSSIDAAVDTVLSTLGRIDVLVNNAIPQPNGAETLISDLRADLLEQALIAQVVNTTYLVQRVLETASATLTVVNIGSHAGRSRPVRKCGEGGSGFSYAAMKAALHQLAPYLDVELADQGVRAFTINPGVVATEALLEHLADLPHVAQPRVPAEVVRWLVCDGDAEAYLGRYVDAQPLHAELRAAGKL
jgi:NAD(P)-dependent dehydrogenase (short-subunit alcohol dehydrogenase family)